MQEDREAMRALCHRYFATLFQSEVDAPDPGVLGDVHRKVTEDMNRELLLPFSYEEVKKALFSIGDFKAPGPDGMHAVSYKKFWDMFGDDLVKEVLDAVNKAEVPEGWNNTTVVLIPKVKNPTMVSQFHPISLCNVLYKVISKMPSLRLKNILPEVISDHQSAFFSE